MIYVTGMGQQKTNDLVRDTLLQSRSCDNDGDCGAKRSANFREEKKIDLKMT